MMWKLMAIAAATAFLGVAGCTQEPQGPVEQRPPLSDLGPGGGLQARDLEECTHKMAMDFLASHKLNSSKTQWTIVFTGMENKTYDKWFDYDIFLARLKVEIAKSSEGRLTLIENKEKFHQLQNSEREDGDRFGQGGRGGANAGIQPDFAMSGVVSEMPERGPYTLYNFQFSVTDIGTENARTIPWVRDYTVRVAK